jgi:hypothetical protein
MNCHQLPLPVKTLPVPSAYCSTNLMLKYQPNTTDAMPTT